MSSTTMTNSPAKTAAKALEVTKPGTLSLPDSLSDLYRDTTAPEDVFIMTITPEIAAEMLRGNEGNRKESDNHIDKYGADMKDGMWFRNGSTLVFCDDERYEPWGKLMDGQTRLQACIDEGEPFSSIVLLHANPKAWETIDTGRRRRLDHVLKMLGYTQSSNVAAVARLSVQWELGLLLSRTVPTNNQVLRWLDEQPEGEVLTSARQGHNMLVNAHQKGFTTSVAGAFHYAVNSHNPEQSAEFHRELMEGLRQEKGSGTYQLLQWVKRVNAIRAHKPNQVTRLAVHIKAWNAWVTGTEVKGLAWRGVGYASEDFPALLDQNGDPIRRQVQRKKGARTRRPVPAAPIKPKLDKEVFGKAKTNGGKPDPSVAAVCVEHNDGDG